MGKIVVHKKLGKGEVLEIYNGQLEENKNNKYIKVDFFGQERIFQFPQAFEELLKTEDEQLNAIISKEREIIKQNNLIKKEEEIIYKARIVEANKKAYIGSKLEANEFVSFGTNSREIYLTCCGRYNWDKEKAKEFGQQHKKLYASYATPENYHVWFVSHNNCLRNMDEVSWDNVISSKCEYIKEIWKEKFSRFNIEEVPRVVFAKTSNNEYVFLGLYMEKNSVAVIDKNGNKVIERTFKRISTTYPED